MNVTATIVLFSISVLLFILFANLLKERRVSLLAGMTFTLPLQFISFLFVSILMGEDIYKTTPFQFGMLATVVVVPAFFALSMRYMDANNWESVIVTTLGITVFGTYWIFSMPSNGHGGPSFSIIGILFLISIAVSTLFLWADGSATILGKETRSAESNPNSTKLRRLILGVCISTFAAAIALLQFC